MALFVARDTKPPTGDDAVLNLLADVPVPLITWEAYLFDEIVLATGNREARTAHSSVVIVDTDHRLASDLAVGTTGVYREANKLSYGIPAQAAAVLATVPGRSDLAVWFVYEPAAELTNGSTAPSCPIALFMDYRGGQNLSSSGLDLVSRSIDYALTCSR